MVASKKTVKKMNINNFDKITLGIVLYLIEKLDGVLGKTHLQKLLFLADLLAVKKFKKKLTSIDYKRYTYGPYSADLDNYTNELQKNDLIEMRENPFINNPSKKYTRFYFKKKKSAKKFLADNIGTEKLMLIDEVVNSYGNMSLQEVLDVVYSLQIIKDSKMNKPLNIAKDIKDETEEDDDIF